MYRIELYIHTSCLACKSHVCCDIFLIDYRCIIYMLNETVVSNIHYTVRHSSREKQKRERERESFVIFTKRKRFLFKIKIRSFIDTYQILIYIFKKSQSELSLLAKKKKKNYLPSNSTKNFRLRILLLKTRILCNFMLDSQLRFSRMMV